MAQTKFMAPANASDVAVTAVERVGLDPAGFQPTRGTTVSRSQLDAMANIALQEVWENYARDLPADAVNWPHGAVYVRDSDAASLTGDAATNQCVSALGLMTAERRYVPRENVFFDQASGTTIAGRGRFQELLQQALEGKFVALGAYVSSRLFRNMEEAIAIKRQFRIQGIELFWVGRPKMDQRDPMAWQQDRSAEMNDELHGRQTGWYVGMQKEYLSAQGYPQGPLPEGFVADEWGPSLRGGRPGRATHWSFNEPLATHIKESAHLYLGGWSYRELAKRSSESEFNGRTPKGRPMTTQWWHQTLTNPKYAGLHVLSVYVGYKPGKDLPNKHVRKRDSALVPCRLPSLISVDDYQQIVKTSLSRWKGPKWRPTYHEDMTSGILYDADCGHRLHVKQRTHYGREFLRVQCYKKHEHESEPPSFYAQDSVAELDGLIGELRLTDRAVLEVVATILERADSQGPAREIKVDPRIAELRAAIASLSDPSLAGVKSGLVAQLEGLEVQRVVVPPQLSPYRAAIKDLDNWSHAWGTATLREKNELLTAAGLKIHLSRRPVTRGRHTYIRTSAIVEIEVRDGMFATALAIMLGERVTALPDGQGDGWGDLWRHVDWIDIETANVHRPTIRIPAAQFEALELARAAKTELMAAA